MFRPTGRSASNAIALIVGACVIGLLAGCQGATRLASRQVFVREAQTANVARLTGTRVYVPSAAPDYPPVALVDGITEVDAWVAGSGWELVFDGALAKGRYFYPTLDRGADEPLEWEGLRRNFRDGKEYAALGWVIVETNRTHVIDAVSIHSVNTLDLPAHRYGVRDAFVHYWDEPTERWVAVVPSGAPRYRDHTVKGNMLPHLEIGFVPVRTDLMRIAIQWTNDTVVTRSLTIMGRPEQYARGTVRLTEVEVFGMPEEGDVEAETATQQLPERQETPASDAPSLLEADGDAAIAVALTYASAYSDHDLQALAATIAPTYFQDGEDAAGFLARLADTFRQFPHFVFRMSDPVLRQLTGASATVTADVWLHLMPLIRTASEGKIKFVLTKIGDDWQIQSIETTPD